MLVNDSVAEQSAARARRIAMDAVEVSGGELVMGAHRGTVPGGLGECELRLGAALVILLLFVGHASEKRAVSSSTSNERPKFPVPEKRANLDQRLTGEGAFSSAPGHSITFEVGGFVAGTWSMTMSLTGSPPIWTLCQMSWLSTSRSPALKVFTCGTGASHVTVRLPVSR